MRATRPRLMIALALALAVLAGAGGFLAMEARGTAESQQGLLAGLVSQALSSAAKKVEIGAVDGALTSDATIRDVVVSDRDGPWLRLDRARIKWRRAALFLRRLEIDELEIGHLQILRRPPPSDKPLLPDLPVKLQIKRFVLADLDLGAPVLGVAMRAAATGDTELGAPADGLVFHLDGRRLDSPGAFFAAISYVPASKALGVAVKLDEPAGGLVSQLGHLAGAPPVRFDLEGDGTLDGFKAALDFHAGPAIDAKGAITLARREAGRDLAVRLGGHLGALLPALAAPVFAGETLLSSDARFEDAGAVSLGGLSLESHLARLDAHGTLDADKAMDFAARIRAVPTEAGVNRAGVTRAGGATIGTLTFDGTLQGPAKAPRIAATLALADAHLPIGTLGRLDARFSATPSGVVTEATTRIALDAEAKASGLAPRDPVLARAIGGSASFALHGDTDVHGDATFRRIEARTPTAAVAYAGDVSRGRVHGRLTGEAPDLSRFAGLVGPAPAGKATFGIDLDGDPAEDRLRADLVADLTGFATGIATVDRVVGRQASVRGRGTWGPDGRATIDELTIDGAHVAARAGGTLAHDAADVKLLVSLPDLAAADPRLAGRAALDARLTGGLDRPSLSLAAALDEAAAMGRPIPHLALTARLVDPRGTGTGQLDLDGMIDGKPARGHVALARQDGGRAGRGAGGWDLSALDVAIGSVTLRGAGALGGDGLARGRLALAAQDLDDLSPLALSKLGGTLALDAVLEAPDGGQSVSLDGRGTNLRAASASLHAFTLRADARDLYRRPVLDADARIDQALVGGQTISGITFTAKGDGGRSAIKLAARAAGFDLDLGGTLVAGPTPTLDLARLSARRGGRAIALSGPATLAFAGGGVDIRHLALGLGGGRLTVEGHAGKTLDLAVDARAIPLAAADIALPGLGLGGTLDAGAKLAGTLADPAGSYHIAIKHLVAPQTRDAGLPPADIAASGRLEGHRATLDAKIAAGRAGTLGVTGSLPLTADGKLDLALRGTLDAAVANAKLAAGGRTVTGRLLVDAKLGGTRVHPIVGGGATLASGSFRDTLLGTRLDTIEGRIAAKGDRIAIEHLSAATPNGGTLQATGDISVDPGAGFPGRIALRGRKATLASDALMTATADLAIDVTGALARNPRIAGRVDVSQVEVGIPDRLPATLTPIPGITHVNAPKTVAARLALAAERTRVVTGKGKAHKSRPALFDAALDVAVSAPEHIHVRGRGVDAELGGALTVTGTTGKPVPKGAFELRHGKLVALGKTMTFTKGKLAFAGDFSPEVDFAAEIQSSDITAQVAVTGPAAAPAFAFTSSPDLPQDEILSRILFQKPSGSLSPFQAVQLAQVAAQFSSGGDGTLEALRKSLGVDSIDVNSDSGGSSVGVSRAIGDRVRVGVKTGATSEETGVTADVDVTRHVRVQSDIRSNGATSLGLGSEVEY